MVLAQVVARDEIAPDTVSALIVLPGTRQAPAPFLPGQLDAGRQRRSADLDHPAGAALRYPAARPAHPKHCPGPASADDWPRPADAHRDIQACADSQGDGHAITENVKTAIRR
jgi:hypothetical protein